VGGDGAPFGALWTCPDCGRAFARRNQTHTCRPLVSLESHFAQRPARIREIFDRVVEVASRSGPVTVLAEQTRIALAARMSFCALTPRQAWLDGHVVLARRLEAPRFRRIETFGPRNHLHAFRLAAVEEVDAEVAAWLAEAYEVGMQRHLGR
jgi:Domain of unknown function (DUF5655)